MNGFKNGSVNGSQKPGNGGHHRRHATMPFANTSRHKPRRWPLALRFIKGAIHCKIILPVVVHALFAALIVGIDNHMNGHLGLPATIIPSLSIVVGLMLVFRNQTSYNRFWEGRNHLTVVITSVRNLTRMFLSGSNDPESEDDSTRNAERAATERTIKLLIAILFATKYHLRAGWGACTEGLNRRGKESHMRHADYNDLLPQGMVGFDHRGLGIPLQLTYDVERYIKSGFNKGWWHAPGASQMSVQLNSMIDAFGRMETIRLTPVPVAYLIHQKQVLALYGMVLPFAMVGEMSWWAVPITTLVMFTFYGIDGIAAELDDPFGLDRIDINMDDLIEDIRTEVLVLLDEWKRVHTNQPTAWFTQEEEGRFSSDLPLSPMVRFMD